MWNKYGKSLAMLLAALVMAVLATYREVSGDGTTGSEWVQVIIGGFTVIVVWAAANVPGFEKAKTLVAAIGLVLNLLVTAVNGGISGDEWIYLAIQFLGALGVSAAKAPVFVRVAPTIDGQITR
jgi:hypothetical protein